MMKKLIVSFTAMALAACGAHRPPQELIEARAAYDHAAQSNAQALVPAELHVARTSLDEAEHAFSDDESSQKTKDLAYIATRKAQRAEALGNAAKYRGDAATAEANVGKTQEQIIAAQQNKLSGAQEQLSAQQGVIAKKDSDLKAQTAATEAERAARLEAEKKANDAMDALSKSLAVKSESRGTVITLSGGVLFATGKAQILPGAQAQLNQVADALKTQAEQHFTIEGHTDNQGTDAVNSELSARRANAVRDYLVVRGVSPNSISVSGLGSTRPVADNKTTEGRAMNRRVEIIVGANNASASK